LTKTPIAAPSARPRPLEQAHPGRIAFDRGRGHHRWGHRPVPGQLPQPATLGRRRHQLSVPLDRPPGGERFQAADRAAGASPAVERHGDVADFTGKPRRPFEEAAAGDDAAADARAEGKVDEVVAPFGGAEACLADGGAVAVVDEPRRPPEVRA
jgi:hypothetical protein